jgi:ABC-type glycerol-3-phosphate transport system substrate-binding protein
MLQPPTVTYMQELKDSFEAASGATVVYNPIPENELYNKVRLSIVGKTGAYDGMFTGAGGAKDFGMSGMLSPIEAAPDIADFFAGDVAQYTVGDKLYGAPLSSDTNIFYWRKDLFEAAGLDPNTPPATYDQLQEYAVKLTTDANGKHPGEDGFDPNNIQTYGLAFKGAKTLASTWEWYNYLYAFGGNVFDDKFNVIVNQPEAVAALQWVTDNFREKMVYPADTLTYDYAEYSALWLQGKVAMGINWPFMYALLQDPAQSSVVDKVNIGRKPSQKTHGGNIGGWSFNVLKSAPNEAVALDFAKWVQRKQTAETVASVGTTPVRISVMDAKQKEAGQPWKAIAENLQDGQMVMPIATGDSWLPIESALQTAIQESLLGQKTPQQALDDAAAAIKGILEKNGFKPPVS